MPMQVRKLEPKDYPWDLLLLADPSRAAIEKYLPASTVFGLIDQQEYLGVLVLQALDPVTSEIKNVAIRSDQQGRGLGKYLINQTLEKCRAAGQQEIIIGTGNSSIGQLALYQKLGFRMIDIEHDFFTKNYPAEIVENGIVCRHLIKLSRTLT